jgi:hypothetical protein
LPRFIAREAETEASITNKLKRGTFSLSGLPCANGIGGSSVGGDLKPAVFMWRFLLHVWRWLRAEIVFGFLIATVFWAAILGWQAAYAPTDSERQKCHETAERSGYKSEECKSFWERTTSDPVAFFTFWLAISTVGLGISTVLLWAAGEKQFRHARRASVVQSRDMQASIAVAKKGAEAALKSADALISAERAHLFVTVDETNILDVVGPSGRFNPGSSREGELDTPSVGYSFKNFGRTHATIKEVGAQLILAPKLTLDDEGIPLDTFREPIVGPQALTEKFGCLMYETLTVGGAMDFKQRKAAFWLDGYIVFEDAFGVLHRYQYTLRYRSGENGFRLQRQYEDVYQPDSDDMDDDIPF